MPPFTIHKNAGVIAGMIVSLSLLFTGLLNLLEFLPFLLLFIIGSLFPDIDSRSSRAILWFNRIMVGITSMVGLYLSYKAPEGLKALPLMVCPLLGLIPDILLNALTIHRGRFHNPFQVGIVVFFITALIIGHFTPFSYYSAVKIALGFFSGFLLHVALDKLFSRFL